MDNKETKLIFYTDIHMNAQFTDFSKAYADEYTTDRFNTQLETLDSIYKKAAEIGATVVFAGDMFHERTKVDVNTFNRTYNILSKPEYESVGKIFLRGNHDSINETMGSPSSIDLLAKLPNSHVVSIPEVITVGDVSLYMLPYSNDNKTMKETINGWTSQASAKVTPCNILVAHLGVDGAFGVGNRKLEGPFTVDDMHPEVFDQVYLGHYHARQNLTDNVGYGGSTIENSFSDAGTEKGYDIFTFSEYNGLTSEFIASEAPKFVSVDTLEDAKANLNAGNFVKLAGDTNMQKKVITLDDNLREHLRFTKLTEDVKDIHIDSNRMDSPKEAVKAYVDEVDSSLLKDSLECLEEALKG